MAAIDDLNASVTALTTAVSAATAAIATELAAIAAANASNDSAAIEAAVANLNGRHGQPQHGCGHGCACAGCCALNLGEQSAPEMVVIESRLHHDDETSAIDLDGFEHIRLPTSIILPRDLHAALATAAEGFPAWDVLDAAHMLVASLIVDLVQDGDRPGFLRKMDRVLRDRVLRDRVKEIAARQKPRLMVP